MRFILSLLSYPTLALVAFAIILFEGLGQGWTTLRGHLHLMPGTPRSIVDTRRMGLA